MAAASQLLARRTLRLEQTLGREPTRSRYFSPVVLWTAAAAVNALVFLVVRPPVGDLWAARARQSATAHGVGVGYWFSWFSGGSTPGNYSVLTPYLSSLLGAAVLGALATVAITPLTAYLARGSAHAVAATGLSALVAGMSLWSGRVPFAVGTAVSIAALIAVRAERRVSAGGWAILSALISPVSAAFLVMGTGALFVVSPRHRMISATTAAAGIASLVLIALIFGMPGPDGFSVLGGAVLAVALGLMLLARPAPYVRVVIVAALVACPVLAVVPNGMGSNFHRLVWICLPIAVVATSTVRLRVAMAACALAVTLGAQTMAGDLWISAQPISSEHYYDTLAAELDRTPALADYRIEVVSDGTHTAAYALLGHAMLARGYETQEDNARNAVLMSSRLDAVSYKVWLDNNAVGFVAIARTTLSVNPENALVRQHRPSYLSLVWSDPRWLLYRVQYPTPVVAAPATVIHADQASMDINVPRAGSYAIRVHWSAFLELSNKLSGKRTATATISDDGFGFTRLTATAPGKYTLHG
jgi:hypothetical protein